MQELNDLLNRLNQHTNQTWATMILPRHPKEVYIVDQEDADKLLIIAGVELNGVSFDYAKQLIKDELEPFERIYEIGIRLKGHETFVYSKYNANEAQKEQMLKCLTYDEKADLC